MWRRAGAKIVVSNYAGVCQQDIDRFCGVQRAATPDADDAVNLFFPRKIATFIDHSIRGIR